MNNPFKTIFWGGLIAGTLDITGACVASWLRAGVVPVRVFQSVAAGLLGAGADTGGTKTAVLGLVLHFCLARVWTIICYLASLGLPLLLAQSILWGLASGIVIYRFLKCMVFPLAQFPQRGTPTL